VDFDSFKVELLVGQKEKLVPALNLLVDLLELLHIGREKVK